MCANVRDCFVSHRTLSALFPRDEGAILFGHPHFPPPIRICLSGPGGQSECYRTGGFQIPRL